MSRIDELDGSLLALTEQLGRSVLKEDLPDDPTIARVVALAMGGIEVVQMVAAYRRANPQHLSVPDDVSLAEFLKNATKAHRKAHPPSKRGRKLSEGRALVWIDQLESDLKHRPTRKEIINRLLNKDKYGANTVSARTADKIAKLYLIITGAKRYSKTEAQWLRKNYGPKTRSPHWWRSKREQWFHDRLEEIGLAKEIRDSFAGLRSSDDLKKKREELESLRLHHRRS